MDSFRCVIGTSFFERPGEHPVDYRLRDDMQQHNGVKIDAAGPQEAIECGNLGRRAWVSVEEEARLNIVIVETLGDNAVG